MFPKKFFVAIVSLACVSLFVYLAQNRDNKIAPTVSSVDRRENIANQYGKIPLHFEPNVGQANEQIKFLSRGAGYSLFLASDEATLTMRSAECGARNSDKSCSPEILQMKFVGANSSPRVAAENELEGKTNYLAGSDPKNWKTDIANFERVRYSQIYDGVDLVFYGNQRQLEYDFVVAPNASPDKIRLNFDGADEIKIADNGDLILRFGENELRQRKPIAYQESNGERKEIAANYSIEKTADEIKFDIGDYDESSPLTIDPVLSYSTFLGGAFSSGGVDGGDSGRGIAVDASGNAYVTGFTETFNDFPLVNPLQTQNTASVSAFVTKINASGTAFVYSTYLNGYNTPPNTAGNTFGNAIAVDSAGKAYVAGITQSCNFPTTPGAYIPANPPPNPPPNGPGCTFGSAGFVVKFNAAGNALEYGTYIASPTTLLFGGAGAGSNVTGIAVDSSGNAYITGQSNEPSLPTTPGAFHVAPVAASGKDVFVMKLNSSGSALLYSTFLGGGSADSNPISPGVNTAFATSIALDGANNAVVTGNTNAASFPVTTGVAQPLYAGRYDGFATKLNASGTGLVYSTFLGSGGDDSSNAAALDASGSAYVASNTNGTNFPVTPTAFRPFPDGGNGSSTALTKLNTSGGMVYSTYIGNGSDLFVSDVAVDAGGNAYVVGSGGFGVIYPVNPIISSGDNFVVKFNAGGTGLFYGTYLNGTNGLRSFARSIALDASGNAFITGNTGDTTFPITAGAPQSINQGGGSSASDDGDAFISKISLLPNDCPAITINPQPLRAAVRNQNYNQQLTATGGTAPYTFSLFPNAGGQLPQSITISPSGTLSGNVTWGLPTAIASIRATDANGCVGVRPYQFKVFNGIRPFDFDGDFKADLAVFRPSNGIWYFLNSFANQPFTGVQWGQSGDIPAAGDFDGDGLFDVAVFRPSNATWYILPSGGGSPLVLRFGLNGDVPAASDYDGDGATNLGVYRPSTGTWYYSRDLISPGTNFVAQAFGISTDKPVPGDYDGDGRTDFAVYRPSEGNWYLLQSQQGFGVVRFGLSGDLPARGDFDGDGKSDFALYRPSEGVWYLLRSSQGFAAVRFGSSSDVPVPSDYDGDQLTDIAVWRPSTGEWWILKSSNGQVSATQFGVSGDIPVPALP